MQVDQILYRAADIMDERGKSKGHYVAPNGSVCCIGAMWQAVGLEGLGYHNATLAKEFLAETLGFKSRTLLHDWNADNDKATVVAGMRSAAALWRAQHGDAPAEQLQREAEAMK